MHRIQLGRLLLCLALFFAGSLFAEEATEANIFLPSAAKHVNWVFSGIVTNERDEQYGYIFQMQRENDKFHAMAALLDAQSKKVILFDESEAIIPEPKANNWQVGNEFMSFNPINDSWIFGFKTKDKKGFNFKVDMLDALEHKPIVQNLRPGMRLLISQTSRLNGHLQVETGEGKNTGEQFVTAKNAWFRQVWLNEEEDKNHLFSGVLCQFNDNSGFYSVNIEEEDAQQGAVTGLCNAQGKSLSMSQFIDVKRGEDGLWHIKISSPKHHLSVPEEINNKTVIAGFITEDKQPGFCVLSQNELGKEALLKPQAPAENEVNPAA
ncbi:MULTISPECIES: hypothetical protein [Legionella]|uniref:Uncharacterized protein n=1 Tax=Legionella septentrionalis TaxID=2498109 RepID=A0A433JKG4_9GAMM|nr:MULTISPECIES: hypothetical protein [Legionella]MCP0914222.1 hypothetical protein [Legionella sp. 27cVA30]RUQ89204.1 hypothetical protein EKM59_03750 [Legionella septentrionalis]RUR00562.1 hypothetical protein ELY11_02060 [Legionella septentrionalis]RUR11763.1 hypothetical protein ELY14_00520 [Legionella septentrionalis]RUR17451.1 hypothetical protein ELY10_00520 [Legionella septentrionalis]